MRAQEQYWEGGSVRLILTFPQTDADSHQGCWGLCVHRSNVDHRMDV